MLQKEKNSLKKLMEKVLTDRTSRNTVAMSAFAATTADVGVAWFG